MSSIVYPVDPTTGRAVLGGAASDDTAAVILARQFERDLTCGAWRTEAESESSLDTRLSSTRLFRIHRQVEGRPYGNTPTDEIKHYRIDRVLHPTFSAIELGWKLGPVGIECKRSGVKIGKPIAQAIDYRRAFWHLDESPEVWFTLGWVFVWPVLPQGGPISSVMSQNRVGAAWPTDEGGVSLSTAGQCLARVEPSGRHRFNSEADRVGRKVGSR